MDTSVVCFCVACLLSVVGGGLEARALANC